MAIRELPNGKWQAVVTVRGADGRKRRLTKTIQPPGGKRQAKQAEDKIRADFAAGTLRPATPDATLISLLDRWLELHTPSVRDTTARNYKRRIDWWIRKHPIAHQRVDKLTAQHLDSHYARLRADGLGAGSIVGVHAVISAALDRAIAWEIIARNPATRARVPTYERAPIKAPGETLTRDILAAAHNARNGFGLWCHLAIVTGARRGEISALRWNDINFSPAITQTGDLETTATIRIRHTLRPDGTIGPAKTGNSIRTVIIDQATTTVLLDAWATVVSHANELGDRRPEQRWIFTDDIRGKTPAAYHWPQNQWARIRTLVPGADQVRLHDLRHRAATILIAQGIPVPDVADRLGNTAAVLMRTYAHATDANIRRAADAAAF
jgi:integrase